MMIFLRHNPFQHHTIDDTSLYFLEILQQIVLKNQLLLGSVNASKQYWQAAVTDLQKVEEKWKGFLSKLITGRFPYPKFKEAISNKTQDGIKNIIVWE